MSGLERLSGGHAGTHRSRNNWHLRSPRHARASLIAPSNPSIAVTGAVTALATAVVAGGMILMGGAGDVDAVVGRTGPAFHVWPYRPPHSGAVGSSGVDSHGLRPAATVTDGGTVHVGANPFAVAAGLHSGGSSSGVSPAASPLAADGIPLTASLAYRQAAAREQQLRPSCGLTWPLLAAIGRVESDHGRSAGATLDSDGVSTPPIIGIALNGNGTALIRDTDNGRLDGDTVYDHAVGPMQFIPSTWAAWGVDADGNGLADPFSIFDATAAAADYLCAAGRNLATTAGQIAAVRSYNDSDAYIDLVLGLEHIYAPGAGIGVPAVPVNRNPASTSAPTLPPVDPGMPPGARPPKPPQSAAAARTSTPPDRRSPSRPPTPSLISTPSSSSSPLSSSSGSPSSTPTPSDSTSASRPPLTHVPRLQHRVLAAFPAEAQADGLAQSRAGALFAAVTIRAHTKDDEATRGQIYRVTRAGTKSRFGPRLPTGCGILTAVAFDRAGHLYVADATSSKRPAPGVFRVNATGATRVLTLPMNSFPTGLVFHAGSLYVSDSDRGAIYRWNRSAQPAPAVLRAPWLADNRLASAHAVDRGGPSGLALHDGRLYIAVPAAGTTHGGAPIGRLFAVPLKPSGSHGPLRLVTTSPKLAAVSGISVAQSGVLWMVSHGRHAKAGTPNGSQQLIRLAPGHKLRVVADEASWMNDPTAVVIDHACRTLHLLNGALIHGTSNIVQLRWRDAAAGQTTRPRRGGLSAQTGMRR